MMIELLSQFTWRRVFCGGPIHVSELILKSISTHQISKKKKENVNVTSDRSTPVRA